MFCDMCLWVTSTNEIWVCSSILWQVASTLHIPEASYQPGAKCQTDWRQESFCVVHCGLSLIWKPLCYDFWRGLWLKRRHWEYDTLSGYWEYDTLSARWEYDTLSGPAAATATPMLTLLLPLLMHRQQQWVHRCSCLQAQRWWRSRHCC